MERRRLHLHIGEARPPARVVSTAVAVTVTAAAGDLFQVGQFSVGLSNDTTAPIANQRRRTTSIWRKACPRNGRRSLHFVVAPAFRGRLGASGLS